MKPEWGVTSTDDFSLRASGWRSFQQSRLLSVGLLLVLAISMQPVQANEQSATTFQRIPTQFIAALGDPNASSGNGAQSWGLWSKDPGPRGVRLKNYDQLQADGGVAPAQWKFDQGDWWLEENGLIMEQPDFPVPPGRYIVTGDREMVAVLTVHPADGNGERRWELDKGAKLYDVTHLPCRSARYTPIAGSNSCSPARADQTAFRVRPGAPMPEVEGCNKQDYAVLFVIAVAVDN
jgi:hypothetical protein